MSTPWRSNPKSKDHRILRNCAKVFADYNEHQPREYWNYEGLNVQWGNMNNYEVVKRIGRGKYSEVYEGINVTIPKRCIIKILRPVKKKKILREIKILQNLSGGTNIVRLYDVVRDPNTNTPSLIFEAVGSSDFKLLYPTFSDMEIRYYMNELLKALNYAHSHGIMHRDIKPYNVVIDHKQHQLRLIDWGLAEFYHKNMEYNVRVASRYFKGPELLVDMLDYDYSLDLWSFGCFLAGLLFKKEPFFRGECNRDQLVKIAKILGTDELESWTDKYGLVIEPQLKGLLGKKPRVPWKALVNLQNNDLANNHVAWDLLDGLLRYDPRERLTAQEAMDHLYFAPLKSWNINAQS